jgi:putative salt-induced outer membrane protein YdiY
MNHLSMLQLIQKRLPLRLWILAVLCFKISAIKAQIINIEERRIRGTNDSTHWYGQVNVGMTMTKVKESVIQLNGDLQLEYKRKKHLWLALSNYNFVKAGNKAFVNSLFQHLRYNYKIKEYFTWECFGQVQQNQIQLITFRGLVGCGLRYRLFRKHKGKSRAYIGTAYMIEQNQFKQNDRHLYHRLSNYFSITYKPTNSIFFQNTNYFQPSLFDFNRNRWSSETDIEFGITKKLSFRAAMNLNYDATLPEAIPKFSFNMMNGLRWKF